MRLKLPNLIPMLLVSLVAASTGSAGQYPAEQRCVELGADCACSEPLNTNEVIPGSLHDFQDSEGGGAKECNGGIAYSRSVTSENPTMVTAASAGLPGGVVDYVLRVDAENWGMIQHTANVGDLTDKTICMRAYRKEDTRVPRDHIPLFNGNDNLKAMTLEQAVPTSLHFSVLWAAGGLEAWSNPESAAMIWDFGNFFESQMNPDPPPTVDGSNCFDNHWCMMELCVDHNFDGTDRLKRRLRITDVETGEVMNFAESISVNSNATFSGNFSRNYITRHFCNRGGSNDGACDGKYRWISHVMEAILDVDDSFWIGPSYEIAGGSMPPAAPILLPE